MNEWPNDLAASAAALAEAISKLAARARDAGLHRVAYLLELAAAEAFDRARDDDVVSNPRANPRS